jgi:xanthine phosphoribosyltransferase
MPKEYYEKTLVEMSWEDFDCCVEKIVYEILDKGIRKRPIYGIPKGGLVLAVALSNYLNWPLTTAYKDECLVVDDTSDTGETLFKYKKPCNKIVTLYYNKDSKTVPDFYSLIQEKNEWIVFPWEKTL